MEVHEAELADWGLQVEVDDVLLADALQVLAVTHPAQVVDDLLVARDLEAVPARRSLVFWVLLRWLYWLVVTVREDPH